ncbi:DUF6636 domain-containing protein [Paractinoplanes atraurantiacus]|uniref:Uncharacterized protein n=1 Tax=Paractinoplanes atraurantiacus TaxID=1036182 RepID=A0A285FT92_9ACTN|nr:DUF6636 domain-containing protein [Actinoplanes atraurantiacus]SNY14445.1 hypothetical protein SAMN05421748_1011164 [Actinoplanes atraurantiacus]
MARFRCFLALALLATLSGCSLLGSGAPTPTGSPAPTPSAVAGLGSAVKEVTEATFQSPSKNIVCALTTSSVRCDILDKNWSPPPQPEDCRQAWGNGMFLEEGKAGFTCAGDTLAGSATQTLEYGEALRAGSIRCDSTARALTCEDTGSSHGFALARADYDLF